MCNMRGRGMGAVQACMAVERIREGGVRGKHARGPPQSKRKKQILFSKSELLLAFFSSHFETELKKKQPLYNTVLLSFFSTQKNFQRILKPR